MTKITYIINNNQLKDANENDVLQGVKRVSLKT